MQPFSKEQQLLQQWNQVPHGTKEALKARRPCKYIRCTIQQQQQLSGDERLSRRKGLLLAALGSIMLEKRAVAASDQHTVELYDKAAGDIFLLFTGTMKVT